MISDIKFGKSKARWARKADFYVYDNLAENAFVGKNSWIGSLFDLCWDISHETLHKVLFKIEGKQASHGLDRWCKKRRFFNPDNSGVSFIADEIGDC
jgi:hypothetical protein